MNTNLFATRTTVYIFALMSWVPAHADFCSTPSTSIAPTITENISYNKKSGAYLYRYKLKNEPSAALSISKFELQISKEPTEIHSPENWSGEFVTRASKIPPYFVWDTIVHTAGKSEVLPSLSPGFPSWAIRSYPSYAIKPGTSLDEFSITSDRLPGIIQYRAMGFTQKPIHDAKEEYEEGTPNCPGWDFHSMPEDRMVTGLVTGPSEPDVISVPIRVRGEDGLHPLWPINPHTAKGNVTVLILSTRDFDAGQIDPTSIQFGPSKVAPINSKLLSPRDDDDRNDEREGWENQIRALNGETWRKSNHQNMLLTFDLAALEIQCVIDRAIFLRGKTLDGKNIVGGATTNLLGCDLHHPDVRPDHHKIELPKKKHKKRAQQ